MYNRKGSRERACAEHFSDDLGLELEDSFEQDFNAKLEDGSPYEVRSAGLPTHELPPSGRNPGPPLDTLLRSPQPLFWTPCLVNVALRAVSCAEGCQGAGAAAQRAAAGQLRHAGRAAQHRACRHIRQCFAKGAPAPPIHTLGGPLHITSHVTSCQGGEFWLNSVTAQSCRWIGTAQ